MSSTLYFTRDTSIRVIDLSRLVDPQLLAAARNRGRWTRPCHPDPRPRRQRTAPAHRGNVHTTHGGGRS